MHVKNKSFAASEQGRSASRTESQTMATTVRLSRQVVADFPLILSTYCCRIV